MASLSRRRFLRHSVLLALAGALPLPALARLVSKPAPVSAFDETATAEAVTEGLDLTGFTYAVTGCNSGLGFETMRVLALRGAHVIGIARSLEKAELACAAIDGHTTPEYLDLADFPSIVACAQRIRAMNLPLDGLVCNAGIVAVPQRELVNGVEKHFCVNHLGHFILVNQLLDHVIAAEQGRVVFVSSRAHRRAPEGGILLDDLAWEHHDYDPQVAYGHSKLANALCSRALAHKLSGTMATSNSLHPGVIVTNAIRNMPAWQQTAARWLGWMFTKTVEEGAATQTYLATHPSLAGVRGYYFDNCNVGEGTDYLTDDALALELWDRSAALTADYLPAANA
ncbi:MAG: SDR family NAD(P)-dependent oxidoreductase [Halieaceae bacterium]|jgi:NAD(P)-dependent dehydrogenase (short-subunit alcohol dehydrogenase family)|nr:SDR family NAD(P)-dependent oxidoreductase [Halieaceae bacterium]